MKVNARDTVMMATHCSFAEGHDFDDDDGRAKLWPSIAVKARDNVKATRDSFS